MKKTDKNKILFLIPSLKSRGGIISYYQTLLKYLKTDYDIFERGAKKWPHRNIFILELFRALSDNFKLTVKLITKKYNAIFINSNLELYSLLRDSFFILLGKFAGKQVITFIHGWEVGYQEKIEKNIRKIFKYIILKSDSIIVLSDYFSVQVKKWGYSKKIYVETSVVDDVLTENINLKLLTNKYADINKIKILFFSRLEKEKGIYELIKAIDLLKLENEFELSIAGFGSEADSIKEIANNNAKLKYLGYLTGEEKIQIIESSHLMCLPSYSEGMPISVLEGMAFGLPIICTKTGGLNDIIKEGENGYFLQSTEPDEIADKIKILLSDRGNMIKISINNYLVSKEKFYASKVALRIENIIKNIN